MKRILSILLILTLLFSAFSALGLRAYAYSGTYGEDLRWSFDPSTGKLIISGTDPVPKHTDAPWAEFKDQIKCIQICGNYVNANAFYNYTSAEKVIMSSCGVDSAFGKCSGIKQLYLKGDNFLFWPCAFLGCTSLEAVYIDSFEAWNNNLFCYDYWIEDTMPEPTTNPFYYGANIYIGTELVTELIIPESVTSVQYSLFAYAGGLERVVAQEGLISIGAYAFFISDLKDAVIMNPSCTIGRYGVRSPDLVIHAAQGSTAHSYATANKHTFHACTFVNNGDGTHDYYCTVCQKSVVENSSHKYVEGICYCGEGADCSEIGHTFASETTLQPTCTQEGQQKNTCKVCSYSEIVPIPATGHLKLTMHAAVAPTCTQSGNIDYWSCNACNANFADKEATQPLTDELLIRPAKGHNYTSVVTLPSCTSKGFTTYTCSFCLDSYVDHYSDMIPHHYIDVVTEPTCSEPGFTTHTCSYCGDSYVDHYTDMIPHHYIDVITEPTCSEPGFTTHTCSYCGDTSVDQFTDPTGHVNTTTTTIQPTCTLEGSLTITCNDCGVTITTTLPATGHSHQPNRIAPTCTESGYIEMICHCGDRYIESYIDPTGHSWSQWDWAEESKQRTCILCGAIDVIPFTNPFSDVTQQDYYFKPVIWALNNGITTGLSETLFGPNAVCTRAQVVTFLYRANGSPDVQCKNSPFTDISPSDYYYNAVLWAVENGITTGTSSTSFSPNAECTRAQVVTFLHRTCASPQPTTAENPFSDVSEQDYFYQAVLWSAENKITDGTGGGKFSPHMSCTRGQIVTFLFRAFGE